MTSPEPSTETAQSDSGATERQGDVVAVRGTVLEIAFPGPNPPLASALRCRLNETTGVTAVVHAHIDSSRVRAIALGSTRGLRRGAAVRSDGGLLSVPVGSALLGRVVDLEGRPLDGEPPLEATARRSLRGSPPPPGERRPWSEVYGAPPDAGTDDEEKR